MVLIFDYLLVVYISKNLDELTINARLLEERGRTTYVEDTIILCSFISK